MDLSFSPGQTNFRPEPDVSSLFFFSFAFFAFLFSLFFSSFFSPSPFSCFGTTDGHGACTLTKTLTMLPITWMTCSILPATDSAEVWLFEVVRRALCHVASHFKHNPTADPSHPLLSCVSHYHIALSSFIHS